MPVFYTPIPQNLRVGLAHASSSVFINNRTRDSGDLREHSVEDEGSHYPRYQLVTTQYEVFWLHYTMETRPELEEGWYFCSEVSSHLPLQMLLYFNMFFFPFWWISEVVMLDLKFSMLPGYYQCLMVMGMVLISLFEVVRVYLGYVGNLKEKVPELAGFWLISFLFQLPILLFFLTDEGLLILPLERAVHSLYLAFLLGEVSTSFMALRVMTRKLALQFHLRQFGLHATETLSVFGARSVLPMLPVRDIQPQ